MHLAERSTCITRARQGTKEPTMRRAHAWRSQTVTESLGSPEVAPQYWFDGVIASLSAWLVGGAYVDGWAHTHGKVDATFLTPWHIAFYTGFLAVAGALVGASVYQGARRWTWWPA